MNVWGSNEERKRCRNEAFGVVGKLGQPALFITLTPNTDNGMSIAYYSGLTGVNSLFDLEFKNMPDQILVESIAMKDYCASARLYDRMIHTFLTTALGWDPKFKCSLKDGGLFGHVTAYYGMTETQGGATLHRFTEDLAKWFKPDKDVLEEDNRLKQLHNKLILERNNTDTTNNSNISKTEKLDSLFINTNVNDDNKNNCSTTDKLTLERNNKHTINNSDISKEARKESINANNSVNDTNSNYCFKSNKKVNISTENELASLNNTSKYSENSTTNQIQMTIAESALKILTEILKPLNQNEIDLVAVLLDISENSESHEVIISKYVLNHYA